MTTKELIEKVKIHRYEKCDEFSTPLMNEVIKRLEEHNKLGKLSYRAFKLLEEIVHS